MPTSLAPAAAPPVKSARLGGEIEEGFETSFATLAHAYIRDRAPSLMGDVLGFQVVDRSDDNSRATGVFGFDLSGVLALAPVFFLEGDLRGHEMLYLPGQDLMVPLKDAWIETLRGEQAAGAPAGTAHERDLGSVDPSFREFGRRTVLKGASDVRTLRVCSPGDPAPWAKAAMDKAPGGLWGAPTGDPGLLGRFLADLPRGLATKLAATLDRRPAFKRAMDRRTRTDAAAFLRAPSLFPAASPRDPLSPLAPDASHLKIATDAASVTDPAARRDLLRDGVSITDTRAESLKTRVYRSETRTWQTPAHSGLYRLVEADGATRPVAIFFSPLGPRDGYTPGGRDVLVVRTEPDDHGSLAHAFYPPRLLQVEASPTAAQDLRDWVQSVGVHRRPERGEQFLLVDPEADQASKVFETSHDRTEWDRSTDGDLYVVDRAFQVDYYREEPPDPPPPVADHAVSRPWAIQFLPADADPRLSLGGGHRMFARGGVLQVPDRFLLIQLHQERPGGDSWVGGADRTHRIYPATDSQVLDRLTRASDPLTVFKAGADSYVLKTACEQDTCTRPEALIGLVARHGLGVPQAREAVKQADARGALRLRVRYAPGYPLSKAAAGVPVDAPRPFDPVQFREAYPSGNQVIRQDAEQRVESAASRATDPGAIFDPYHAEPAVAGAATDAAAAGGDEGFDVAMLSALLRGSRRADLVDKYMPELMRGLDRLCRILFLSYWHTAQFEDRYGKDDLEQLQESLRSAMEAAGDVTLFLRQRQVAPQMPNLTPEA